MTLIDEHQRIGRQVIDERRRRLTGGPPGKIPRIVFNALAIADLGHHLEVEARTLLDALRFDELHLPDEIFLLCSQLQLDVVDGRQHLLSSRHVVG